jgi:hypothetical protein
MHWLVEGYNSIQWGNSFRVDLFKVNLGYLVLLTIMLTLIVGEIRRANLN